MRLRRGPRDPKHRAELGFWRERAREAPLESGGDWYRWAFTEAFGIDPGFYAGKRVLDVGCGPRGTLEWADTAAERVGVDPLADAYRDLHARPHAMTYVAAGAEALPFPDGHFDVVGCFNALDHVDDLQAATGELGRVAAPGATLLLVVDIGHEPTAMEPHRLSWDLLEAFAPAWTVMHRRDLERASPNMLANLQTAQPFDHADGADRPGVLQARLERRA